MGLTRLQTRIAVFEQTEIRLRQELEIAQKEVVQCKAFIEKASDIIYKTDNRGYFTYANPASEKITGYDKKGLIGRHYSELIRPDYLEEAARVYGKQFVDKISDTYFEFPLLAKDGREVWVGQHVQLLTKEDQVVGFQAIARDITARKAAEESLKISEERLKYLSSELLATQERERREIARELHDSIGASLSAIKFKAENILAIEKQDTTLFALLSPLVTWIQHAIMEIRRICQNLRPAVLDDLGLIATLFWFCREFERTYPISVLIQTEIEENDVPESLKIVIFRIKKRRP
jgi:PAS domain S-box-containing protein